MITSNDRFHISNSLRATTYSDDLETKVGCVIVPADKWIAVKRITSINRIPVKLGKTPSRVLKPLKYKYIEHAERAAIYTAAMQGISLENSTMYVTWFPCVECARAIISVGISRLVCVKPDLDNPRWGDDFKVSLSMLKEAKVKIDYYNPEKLK